MPTAHVSHALVKHHFLIAREMVSTFMQKVHFFFPFKVAVMYFKSVKLGMIINKDSLNIATVILNLK